MWRPIDEIILKNPHLTLTSQAFFCVEMVGYWEKKWIILRSPSIWKGLHDNYEKYLQNVVQFWRQIKELFCITWEIHVEWQQDNCLFFFLELLSSAEALNDSGWWSFSPLLYLQTQDYHPLYSSAICTIPTHSPCCHPWVIWVLHPRGF